MRKSSSIPAPIRSNTDNMLPHDTNAKIKALIIAEIEEKKWMSMSKTAARALMTQLVERRDIGGRLKDYMPPEDVRTWIKEAVFNNYPKKKRGEAHDLLNHTSIIKGLYGCDCALIDEPSQDVRLYRSEGSHKSSAFVVVADGTFLKWETALRKALLFLPGKPFMDTGVSVHTLLTLYAKENHIIKSKKDHLAAALNRCHAKVHVYGEP